MISLWQSLAVGFTFFGAVMGGMFALVAWRLNRPARLPRRWNAARRHRFLGDAGD